MEGWYTQKFYDEEGCISADIHPISGNSVPKRILNEFWKIGKIKKIRKNGVKAEKRGKGRRNSEKDSQKKENLWFRWR